MSLDIRALRRARPTRRRTGAALLAAVAMLATSLAVAATPAGAQAPGRYVALGDSFTAGPLIPDQTLEYVGCLRSDRDYPANVQRALGFGQFVDASCSGADTGHMTGQHGVWPVPNPPQFDRLTADTTVVTVGIGGNDIGFASIIESCVTLAPWTQPCRDTYAAGGVDQLAQRIAATAPKVAAVIEGIRGRSPAAAVYVVGYPAIVPDSGSGCWPSLPLAWRDVAYLRATHKALNAMLAEQAAAHGAVYVDTYTPSIGRDACRSASTRWVEPLIPANPAAPVHPNARGMQGMADVVAAAISATG
jgi:lysophospholipase L1-like esterase